MNKKTKEMILTGKSKEDFLNSLGVSETWFRIHYMPIFLHALIIEWFDSVGIYIEVSTSNLNKGKFDYTIKGYRPHAMYLSLKFFKDRAEATKQAIIKANQLYNEKVES